MVHALMRLQSWYARQIKNEVDESRLVEIRTISNPGWFVNIELKGTVLEKVPFAEISEGLGDHPLPQWIVCYVELTVWKGGGDETQLERVIETFVEWAEAHGS